MLVQTFSKVRPELGSFRLPGASAKEAVEDAVRAGMSLQHIQMPGDNFYEADIPGIDLIQAHLTGGDYTGADMQKAIMTWVQATDVNFTGANMRGIKSLRGVYARCKFSDVDMTGGNISESMFYGGNIGDMGDAIMRELIAQKCFFMGIGFEGHTDASDSDFLQSKFIRCGMERMNLRGSRLTGCEIRSNLDGADLTGAIIDGQWLDMGHEGGSSTVYIPPANFVGSSMEGVKGIALERTTPLAIFLEMTGKIPAYIVIPKDGVDLEPGQVMTSSQKGDETVRIPLVLRNLISTKDNAWKVETCAEDIHEIPFGSEGLFYVNKATVVGKLQITQTLQ